MQFSLSLFFLLMHKHPKEYYVLLWHMINCQQIFESEYFDKIVLVQNEFTCIIIVMLFNL